MTDSNSCVLPAQADHAIDAKAQAQAISPRLHAALKDLQDCSANTSSPVDSLPPEILHMVFKEAVTPAEIAEEADWRRVLALTHVCRLWRTMVVKEASFWCHIYLNAPRVCIELFIDRSSNLPLIFYTSFYELKHLDDVLDEYGFRARAVHVHQKPEPEPEHRDHSIALLNRLFWSAPQVQCFTLRAFLDWYPERRYTPQWTVFSETVSPLKALRLEGICLWGSIPANSFPNLTHLFLHPTAYGDHFQLLDMLATAAQLQYLHFVGLNLDLDEEFHSTLPHVALPRVRALSIHRTDLAVALFLLRHMDLPAECALCVRGGSSELDFADPSTFPRADALDFPPLAVFDTVTAMDLSVSSEGFLIAGHNAPHGTGTAGFVIDVAGCGGHVEWLADSLRTMLPLAKVTVLNVRVSIDAAEPLVQLLPHFPRVRELCFLLASPVASLAVVPSPHSDRALIELFLGALRPTSAGSSDVVACPELQVLGLEAALAHCDFPFPALEHTASARKDAGCPLRRFVFHPGARTRTHDSAHLAFAASFTPLAALVGEVEVRRAGDAERVCALRSPEGGCWDVSEAERFWRLPGGMMSYGQDPDPGLDLDLGRGEGGGSY